MLEDKVIRLDAIHEKKVGYHTRSDRITWVRPNEINPIPLVPTFLEGLGFERNPCLSIPTLCYIDQKTEEEIQCIFRKNGTIDIAIWNKEDKEIVKIWTIKYVHEFQNILRYSKIESDLVSRI